MKVLVSDTPPHNQAAFDEYLRWLQRSTRTHIKFPYALIEEDSEDEEHNEDPYDEMTRTATQPVRAPLQRHVVSNSNID